MECIEGRVWKFGDNIDTDVIIPARYLVSTDPQELGSHLMEPLDPDFSKKIEKGDIIVAGRNFGSGSSREHAPLAIKGAGISAVIAVSFARIFFRNAINTGLPIIESEEIANETQQGDRLKIDFKNGTVQNLTSRKEYRIAPFPEFIQKIIESGGLIEYARRYG